MAPRNQQASATIGRKPSTVNIRFRTWPTISRAQRASGSPGTLPLVRPLLRVRVRTVRITQIPWDGATHLSTDMDVVRRGHSSNLSSRQQPVNQLSTGQRSRPNGSPGHANVVIWSWSLQARLPLIQKGWQAWLLIYQFCHDEQQVRFRKCQQASLVLQHLYCCLYKIEG